MGWKNQLSKKSEKTQRNCRCSRKGSVNCKSLRNWSDLCDLWRMSSRKYRKTGHNKSRDERRRVGNMTLLRFRLDEAWFDLSAAWWRHPNFSEAGIRIESSVGLPNLWKTGKMDGKDDEEYITNRHNPDMSEEKWDNRWEKAKQVRNPPLSPKSHLYRDL